MAYLRGSGAQVYRLAVMDDVWRAVCEYQRAHGRPASVTDVQSACGMGRGTAFLYLNALEERGIIEVTAGARGMRVKLWHPDVPLPEMPPVGTRLVEVG